MIWAYGSSNEYKHHQASGTVKVNFVAGTAFEVASTDVVAHGVMMALGLGVAAPVGALMARFGKDRFPSPTWFHAHRGLQAFSVVLVLSALLAVWVPRQRNGGGHFGSTHAQLGLVLVLLVVLQVALGVTRPPPNAAHRDTWSTAHRGLGWGIALSSLVNMGLGITLYGAYSGGFVLLGVGATLIGLLFVTLQCRYAAPRSEVAYRAVPLYEHVDPLLESSESESDTMAP